MVKNGLNVEVFPNDNADWHQDKTLIPVVLNSFVEEIKEYLGDDLIKIILFGSVARNEVDPDDIDVCVVVKGYSGYDDERNDAIIDIAYQIDSDIGDYKTYLAPLICSETEYNASREPIYRNIKNDGDVLYAV